MAALPPDSLSLAPAAGPAGGHRIAQITLDEATMFRVGAALERAALGPKGAA